MAKKPKKSSEKPAKLAKPPIAEEKKRITWLTVLIYLAIGYVLMNIVQAIFCGTSALSQCNVALWIIPLWLLIGAILLWIYKKK